MFSNRICKSLVVRSAIVILLAACTALAQIAPKKPASKSASEASSSKSSSVKRSATHGKGSATVADAQAFMKKAEDQLEDLNVRASRASWVQENFITDDTEAMSAQANEKLTAVVTQLALDARRFDGLKMPPELERKFMLLKLSLTAPAPNNDAERAELTRIATSLDADYGKGKYCKPQADGKQKCLSLNDLSRQLVEAVNPDRQVERAKQQFGTASPSEEQIQ